MDNEVNEDKIQQQMKETRASLTEKLETLEQKVVGTVENATTAVTETVESIRETVHETVATVQEGVKDGVDSVKDFLDVPTQVQRRPWLMVGGSVAVGYCLGSLFMHKSERASQSYVQPSWLASQGVSHSAPRPASSTQSSLPATPTSEPNIWSAEVDKLKALALGTLFGTARELLISSLPENMGAQLREVVDSVTKKVGGKPIPSSDWDKLREPVEDEEASSQEPVGSQEPRKKDAENGHSPRRW